MKIDVTMDTGKHFCIPFPTWLGLNRITAGIAFAYYREELRKQGIDLDLSDIYRYLSLFRRVERQYKGMCIVDVESADGEKVKIYL